MLTNDEIRHEPTLQCRNETGTGKTPHDIYVRRRMRYDDVLGVFGGIEGLDRTGNSKIVEGGETQRWFAMSGDEVRVLVEFGSAESFRGQPETTLRVIES